MVMVPEIITRRRLTLEDYLALPDDADYEIIDGVLYVAPRSRPGHQIVAGCLAARLTLHAEKHGLGVAIPDVDLIIESRNTYISPDIMYFVADRFAGVDLEQMIRIIPDLVIEVVSPTSADYDRWTKRRLYAELGVPHYWIVDPDRRTITEHILAPTGDYNERIIAPPEPFRPSLFPDLTIDLAQLFARSAGRSRYATLLQRWIMAAASAPK